MADSLPIFGSRKKSWILLWGIVQTFALSTAALVEIESVNVFMVLIMFNSLATCFMDVIVDSLMVM